MLSPAGGSGAARDCCGKRRPSPRSPGRAIGSTSNEGGRRNIARCPRRRARPTPLRFSALGASAPPGEVSAAGAPAARPGARSIPRPDRIRGAAAAPRGESRPATRSGARASRRRGCPIRFSARVQPDRGAPTGDRAGAAAYRALRATLDDSCRYDRSPVGSFNALIVRRRRGVGTAASLGMRRHVRIACAFRRAAGGGRALALLGAPSRIARVVTGQGARSGVDARRAPIGLSLLRQRICAGASGLRRASADHSALDRSRRFVPPGGGGFAAALGIRHGELLADDRKARKARMEHDTPCAQRGSSRCADAAISMPSTGR